jgi:hypothetical protein
MKTALTRDPTLSGTSGYVAAMSGRLGQLMIGG